MRHAVIISKTTRSSGIVSPTRSTCGNRRCCCIKGISSRSDVTFHNLGDGYAAEILQCTSYRTPRSAQASGPGSCEPGPDCFVNATVGRVGSAVSYRNDPPPECGCSRRQQLRCHLQHLVCWCSASRTMSPTDGAGQWCRSCCRSSHRRTRCPTSRPSRTRHRRRHSSVSRGRRRNRLHRGAGRLCRHRLN